MAKIGSIGVDVGGTKIRIALFDDAFNVIESIKSKTPKRKEQFTAALKKTVRQLVEKADEHSLLVSALGVGVAGSLNRRNGVVQSAPNIPFLEGFSFLKALSRISRCRVVFTMMCMPHFTGR
jgi:glucokinase